MFRQGGDNSCNQRTSNEATFKGEGKVWSRHFFQKSLDLVSCSSPPPLRWREKFCAIKTFVFCSTIALHCFADNKRESQPKEGNISNQMPPNHLKNALLSLWSVCFLRRWREPKMTRDSLPSMDVCWFRRAGHAVLWLRPGKDTRHVTCC